MANKEQLEILRQGIETWNAWREGHKDIIPDLTEANLEGENLNGVNLYRSNLSWSNLEGAKLIGANLYRSNLQGASLAEADLYEATLTWANLIGVNLRKAKLIRADLERANLYGAYLVEADLGLVNLAGTNLIDTNLAGAYLKKADLLCANLQRACLTEVNLEEAVLRGADLREVDLRKADLSGVDLRGANLSGADLSGANLTAASLVSTNLSNAKLVGCRIYGISSWNLKAEGIIQSDLIITRQDDPIITVDNLEVAQFVYLLIHNEKIRNVIDTIGKKAVLILGRFSLHERKDILEGMRNLLREKGYIPIVFDFEKSEERDFTETIQVLAGMCLFVIADITNPKSSPLELQATVPDYMIPFVPIIQDGENPFAMFVNLQTKFRWVLDVRTYHDKEHLLNNFENGIIKPALAKHNQLLIEKNEALKIRPIDEI